MPESPEELYARVVERVGAEGRLPMPALVEWDVFPWEGDLRPKVLKAPLEVEPPRQGEDAAACWCAVREAEHQIWRNDRWTVRSMGRPTGMPLVLFLESREHLDLDELDDDMAGELGRITGWLHRIVARLPHVGRVHVMKIGDGSAHLHVWFVARPARFSHIVGSMAVEWDDMLPPAPDDVWRADLVRVAGQLATHDGQALV